MVSAAHKQRSNNDIAMSKLVSFIKKETLRPIDDPVAAAAKACMKRFGKAAIGVIYYGSCLRTGEIEDRVLDFYVLVDDYQNAYKGWFTSFMNHLLPPNVYYSEIEYGDVKVRSKYAVLSIDDFERRANGSLLNVSVWARFCQPTAIVYHRDDATLERMHNALANATRIMIGAAIGRDENRFKNVAANKVWPAAFDLTYGAELRAEKGGKGLELYNLDASRYDKITPYIIASLEADGKDYGGDFKWACRRLNGKLVSFLRLIKAAFTFDGGIDYLAWKISRHSGVKIEPTAWQRRHPILAGLGMFWKLRKRGAFR